jgi:hypothetical protein
VHPRTDRLSRQDRELALSFAAVKQLAIWLVYALDLVEIFLGFLCKSHVYIVKVFVEKGQKTMTYLDGLCPKVTRQHEPRIKPAIGIRWGLSFLTELPPACNLSRETKLRAMAHIPRSIGDGRNKRFNDRRRKHTNQPHEPTTKTLRPFVMNCPRPVIYPGKLSHRPRPTSRDRSGTDETNILMIGDGNVRTNHTNQPRKPYVLYY